MDLINKLHPHAANYNLRQVLEHTSKLLEEVEKQREQGAKAQGIAPFQKTIRFDEKLSTQLKETFKCIERTWGMTALPFNPNYKALAYQLAEVLKQFRERVAEKTKETSLVAAHNKAVGEAISALLETVGIKPSYQVNVPNRKKLFNFVEHQAGYRADINRVTGELQQDGTHAALTIAQGLEKNLEAYVAAQKELERLADVRSATHDLRLITSLMREKYGFTVTGYEAQDIAESLGMGLEVVSNTGHDLDDYKLNEQVHKIIHQLYLLNAITQPVHAKILSYLSLF